MYPIPQRARRGSRDATPMSFFAITNLRPREEAASMRSKSMALSDIEEVSSAHEGLTALPAWRAQGGPKRPFTVLPRWESVHLPKRPLSRHGSQDHIFEKGNMRDTEAGILPPRSGASSEAGDDNPRHSRMMVWLILVLVIVLILAIVLGAVLGTFINPGGSSGPDPSVTEIPAGEVPTPTPSPTPTGGGGGDDPEPTWPPHIESLAVTGWSVPGQSTGYFTTSLFSQNSKGNLNRYSFNSSTGNWTRVSNFAKAKVGTPLAAAAFSSDYYDDELDYEFTGTHYQAEVVFLNENNYLSEWLFPDDGSVTGMPGTLDQQKYIAHQDTKLAFYWPRLMYQGMSGEIRETRFDCHVEDDEEDDECWHDKVLRTSDATNGTRLATLPMQNSLSSTGLFYQEKDGRYANYISDRERHESTIWVNPAFSDRIPRNSSIAAFSTTRSTDPDKNADDKSLNTYLLWQDLDGTIQMSWSDSDEGWKGPITHPAFAGADNNTALACLTGLSYPGFPLAPGTELSRCYFQTGPAIREVSFDGNSWDIVGNVPIEF